MEAWQSSFIEGCFHQGQGSEAGDRHPILHDQTFAPPLMAGSARLVQYVPVLFQTPCSAMNSAWENRPAQWIPETIQ
ncbi:hypothetical protein IF690_15445 [Pseudomonas sp. SK3(2021)]|uniref:hypothetical protein n=1 Tax=Pseudomonas sp. SK3(2021) TaxID=2841064 RepID=UPI00192CB3DF|nr:hypothetical protein [Pseudomonas sp. SK3(2021)]QQZ39460.1 hypothetical protein IF690_15445 [Pseudomonas sp. SK3(2021)]